MDRVGEDILPPTRSVPPEPLKSPISFGNLDANQWCSSALSGEPAEPTCCKLSRAFALMGLSACFKELRNLGLVPQCVTLLVSPS